LPPPTGSQLPALHVFPSPQVAERNDDLSVAVAEAGAAVTLDRRQAFGERRRVLVLRRRTIAPVRVDVAGAVVLPFPLERAGATVDRSGREVIPTTWTGIARFENGLARMESGSLFGGLRVEYIDRDGKVVWRAR
jgi:WG repeat protein